MWETFKFLAGALFVLLLAVPIITLIVKIAGRVGLLIHEWQLARAETESAWAETRNKQLWWKGPDEKGFTGLVFDGSSETMTDTDSGRVWKLGEPLDPGHASGMAETANRQRLFAALTDVHVEKKDIQGIAGNGTARFKVEAETLLNEPARRTAPDDDIPFGLTERN